MNPQPPDRLRTWGPTALYVVLCAVLWRFFWYNIGPDLLSYLSIANHYVRGEWSEAINTGWSPVTSWLCALLMAVGVPDLAALHVVVAASGVLLLYVVRKLAEDFELNQGWQRTINYTTAFLAVVYTMVRGGADLPEAAFLLLYIRVVVRNDYGLKGRSGLIAGAWGAAAYLTKGYALYFFLGHFALANMVHFWRLRGREGSVVVRQWALGMLAFVVLTGPWFAAMSYKMGHFSTGTTGSWNYRLVGPNSPGYPQYYKLIPLPSEHASSMWEEPSPELLPAWSPLGSAAELKHQIRLLAINVKLLVTEMLYVSLLSLGALLAFTAWGWGRSETGRVHWLLISATVLVYPAGYMLILVQDRYLWCIDLLLLLMGAKAVQEVSKGLRPAGARLLAAGYVVSFLLVPVRMLTAQYGNSQWATTAQQLHQQVPDAIGRVAGCGGWLENVEVAWGLKMQFIGEVAATPDETTVRESLNPSFRGKALPEPDSSEALERKFADYQVEYFLAQPSCEVLPETLRQSKPVAEAQGTRLYRLERR